MSVTPTRIRGPVLVTGGAGFIGSQLAARLLELGFEVIVYDNLARAGVAENLEWLARCGGARLQTRLADVRDRADLQRAVRGAGCVFHCAAQVEMDAAVEDPRTDFEVNVGGTLNVLEAIRHADQPIPLVFASTTAVYGGMRDIELVATATRCQPRNDTLRHTGVDEGWPLEFCGPCGCSQGAADQYVLEYARSFGVAAVVMRLGTVYGPHPCGNTQQDRVAHALQQARHGRAVTLAGDGLQVRDMLHVDDAVDALLLGAEDRPALRGRVFNLGGGPANTISQRELIDRIAAHDGQAPRVLPPSMPASDPRWFVADSSRFAAVTGWRPRVTLAAGLARLFRQSADDACIEPEPVRSEAHVA